MKLKSFFTSVLATLALAVGCTQELIPSLKEISVTPSYLTMEVEGGTKELTVVSTGDWKITDIPDGMTVTPSSGSASPEGTKVIVKVDPTTNESVNTVYLKLVCGNETQLISITQKAFIPPFPAFVEGDYWIVCGDQALKPVEGGSYGYLYPAPVNVGEDGKVTSSADNVFTFKAVDGGYTIQDKNDMYYYMAGTYNSFNIAAEMPSSGAVWTVEQISGDAFKIINASNGKVMQYSTDYKSAGAYDAIDPAKIMPFLVKVEGEPEPEPEPELGDPSSIADIVKPAETAVIEGVVTGVCTSGVILTDETASIFAYKIGSDLELGDKVKVQGALADYQYGYQLKAPYTTQIISNDNAFEYPVATEITEENVAGLIPSDKMLAQYVTVKGKVTLDKYGNALISVGDYNVKTYYGASDAYTEYDGKGIELSGYFVSYKESSKELNVLVTVHAPYDLPAEGGDEGGNPGEGENPGAGENPGEGGDTPAYTMISSVADLTAGTYYMGGYAESYGDNDFSDYPYHLCTGVSSDLFTTQYAFSDGKLIVKPESSYSAYDVILEAVPGKDNTYNIKIDGGYLVTTAAENRKLAKKDSIDGIDGSEWVASDFSKGGIIFTTTFKGTSISFGTAGASSKIIRSYKSSDTLVNGVYFFKKN